MPHITATDGLRIHYETAGEGRPLLLMTGAYGTLEAWYDYGWVDALSAERRLIMMDLRGHGRSDRPHDPAAYGWRKNATDAIAVLEAESATRRRRVRPVDGRARHDRAAARGYIAHPIAGLQRRRLRCRSRSAVRSAGCSSARRCCAKRAWRGRCAQAPVPHTFQAKNCPARLDSDASMAMQRRSLARLKDRR